MRLIDADAFEVMTYQGKSEDFLDGAQSVLEQIDAAPTKNVEFTTTILQEFYTKYWEQMRKVNYDSRIDTHMIMGHIIAEMTGLNGEDLEERARKVVEEINLKTCPKGKDIYGNCYEFCPNRENFRCELAKRPIEM